MKTCLLCECTSAGRLVTFRRHHICTDCEASLARRGLAWCTRGTHAVPVAEMQRHPSWCRACTAQARATRYAAGAESERARSRAYRIAHRDQIRERVRAQRRRNPAAARRAALRYYHRHRDRVRAYYARTRDQRLAAKRRWYQRNPDYQRRWRAKKLIQILRGGT